MSPPRAVATLLLLCALTPASRSGRAAQPAAESAERARAAFGSLPLAFEPNVGQAGREARFVARCRGYSLALSPGGVNLALASPGGRFDQVRLTFAGAARKASIEGLDPLPGRSHYLMGNDPARWRRDVEHYRKVRYRGIYPGIDLVLYGGAGVLEYDLIVAPGADPAAIRFRFSAGAAPRLDGRGEIRIASRGGELVLRPPRIYQERAGARVPVEGRVEARGGDTFGFALGDYRHDAPLVIDPVLSYSATFGGSGSDSGAGIAVDSTGNAYLTGTTTSPNFPTTPGAVQPTAGSIFVSKLAASGASLVYSTYLGGTGDEQGLGIAIDPIGAAYVTGRTSSSDFPTTADALRTTKAGGYDAFVAKLTPAGSTLGYSTYVGGASDDSGRSIAVDASGNAYLTGSTASIDFPSTIGAFRTALSGATDAFVAKLNPFGTRLVYASYLGGSAAESGHAIAFDGAGNAYVAGETSSSSFPATSGAFQGAKRAGIDGFVAAFNPTGTALQYATFLGGDGDDTARAIALDRSGNAFVAGTTLSTNFPTTAGAYQTTGRAGSSGFAAKLSPAGSTALYSTLLRWSVAESAAAVAVDSAGAAWVAGRTASSDLPVSADAAQKSFASVALYSSTTAGDAWDAVSSALGPYVTVALAVDPSDPTIVYAGTDAGGLLKSTDSGKRWTASNAGLTDLSVPAIAVNPRAASTLYAGTSKGGVFKSTDRGVSWTAASSGLPAAGTGFEPINALAIDPENPAILYAGTGAGVYKSTSAASSWTSSSNGLLANNVTALAIDPTKTTTLYTAAGSLGVFKSFDSGGTWNAINSGQPRAVIPAIAVDPKNSLTVYAALQGLGLYRSTNAGAAWLPRNTGLLSVNVTAIAMDPTFPSRVYAATSDKGLYKSFDSASQWATFNTGLVNPTLYALAVNPVSPSNVYAGARGGDDVFIVKLNAAGSALDYASYAGGAGDDFATAAAFDSSGGFYVTGTTVSPDFLATTGSFHTTITATDLFVAKIGTDPPPVELTLFPQVAVGRGYSTVFTLSNTGSAEASGTLTLKDQVGEPLLVTLTEPSVAEAHDPAAAEESSFAIAVAPGATRVLVADRPSASDTRIGWARIDTTGGKLGGVSTFRLTESGVLKTIAGVLASQPVAFSTLPVDNDDAAERFTGFAVANHNSDNIDVRIVTLSESGSILDSITPVDLNPLPPGRQASKFMHEYLPSRLKFRGSLVLVASGGKKFGVVALVLDRGLLTVVPVIGAKAPQVP